MVLAGLVLVVVFAVAMGAMGAAALPGVGNFGSRHQLPVAGPRQHHGCFP